jgi:hypothetical protein
MDFDTTVPRPESITAIPNIDMIPVDGSGTVVEVAESGATMPKFVSHLARSDALKGLGDSPVAT